MDQKKIGSFLKKLRKEKGITQEQFAEFLNISARTVSRWETGNNIPDISLLVEIAEFFDVSIPEIIKGERKSEIMEKEVKEVAEMLSDYAGTEKKLLLQRVRIISIVGLISLLIGLVMDTISLNPMIPIFECVKGICFGLSVGALITVVLYNTGILAKIRAKKPKHMKLLAIGCFTILAIGMIASLIASFS